MYIKMIDERDNVVSETISYTSHNNQHYYRITKFKDGGCKAYLSNGNIFVGLNSKGGILFDKRSSKSYTKIKQWSIIKPIGEENKNERYF